jgi:hypothetical protein
MAQLKRKINGINFYCEKITASKTEAEKKKNLEKKSGRNARIIELKENNKKVYGVFVS